VYAAPARAQDDQLARFPPTWMASYQLDPTRDEGLTFARRLIEAGIPTELRHYAGAFHMAHVIPGTALGERIYAEKSAAIRRMLLTPPA
jgi:acetyl esterase